MANREVIEGDGIRLTPIGVNQLRVEVARDDIVYRDSLANAALFNTAGTGMVGHSRATVYPNGTAGKALNDLADLVDLGLGGATGNGSPLELVSDGFAFVFDGVGTNVSNSPAIQFRALLNGITGTPVWTATAYDAAGVVLGAVPLVGAGLTRAMTPSQFTTFAGTHYVKVEIVLGVYSDLQNVLRVDNGSSALNLVLGNEMFNVPTLADGSGENFAGANTQFVRVYRGIVDETNLWTFSRVDTNCTSTINAVAGPISGAAFVNVAVLAMSADAGYVTIAASRVGFPTLTKFFKVNKSPKGATGDAPQVEYSVDGLTLWHPTFVTGDIYARYRSNSTDPWSAASRIVGETGPGGGNYTDFIFIRSATQPATPVGANPVGWSDALPASNGQPAWVSLVEKSAGGIPTGPWATPIRFTGDNGADGLTATRTTTLVLSQWLSAPPTLFPVGASVYTWANSSWNPPVTSNGWSRIPGVATPGQVLYQIEQPYADQLATPTSTVAWTVSTYSVVGAAGANGVDASGLRGSLIGYSTSASPPIYSTAPWNGATDDANASTIIWRILGNAGSPPSDAHLGIGDTVTLRNAAGTDAETRYWGGTTWNDPGTFIKANLLVDGAISGTSSIDIAGLARFEGFSSFSLTDPTTYLASPKTIAVVANTSMVSEVGIVGMSNASGGSGVYGYGDGSTSGVTGVSTNGSGLTAASVNGNGVSARGGAVGVSGIATLDGGVGVRGRPLSTVVGGIGVEGTTSVAGSIGVQATNTGGGTALSVSGATVMNGSATVTGTVAASSLSSTVATGTAPLSVVSTTLVTNLNADLLDGQTGSYYTSFANATGTLSAGQMAPNVIGAIGFTPVRQGSGASQTGNIVHIGWSAASMLRLQIDSTDFASTWPIHISGNAASATFANSATSAVNATNATNATNAVNATNATNATTATNANSINGSVTSGGGTATFVAANKPGGSNSNDWVVMQINGINFTWPVWGML